MALCCLSPSFRFSFTLAQNKKPFTKIMLIFRNPLSVMALCCDLLLSLFRIALSINKCKHKTKQTRTKHPGKNKATHFWPQQISEKISSARDRAQFLLFFCVLFAAYLFFVFFCFFLKSVLLSPARKTIHFPGHTLIGRKMGAWFSSHTFPSLPPPTANFLCEEKQRSQNSSNSKKKKLLMGAKGGLSTHQHTQTLTHTHMQR